MIIKLFCNNNHTTTTRIKKRKSNNFLRNEWIDLKMSVDVEYPERNSNLAEGWRYLLMSVCGTSKNMVKGCTTLEIVTCYMVSSNLYDQICTISYPRYCKLSLGNSVIVRCFSPTRGSTMHLHQITLFCFLSTMTFFYVTTAH